MPAVAETITMPLAPFWEKSANTDMLTVKFRFGGAVTGSQVRPVNTKQFTNAWHKSDEVACERALLNALLRLQGAAQQSGGTQVQGIKSGLGGFKDSSTEYICDKSHFKDVVNLQGTIVK